MRADGWRDTRRAGDRFPVFPGIQHASEEIVDGLAMAAVESGAAPEPERGHPRVYAHLKTICSGEPA